MVGVGHSEGFSSHFVRQYAHEYQRPMRTLSNEVLAYLQAYAWPGNVRQLIQWMQRAVIVCEGQRMERAEVGAADDVGLVLPASAAADETEPPRTADEAEKQRLMAALKQTNWVVSGQRGAARLLGMSHQKLVYRMERYGIQRPKKGRGPADGEAAAE